MGSAGAAFRDDDTNINRYTAIPGAVRNSSDEYEALRNSLVTRIGADYTVEDYNKDLREAKENLLKPYLLNAAIGGNVESLRLALANPNNVNALSRLNEKQQQLVYEVHNSSFFDGGKEITDFMNSTLRGVEDKEQETKIQIDQNIKLMDGFNLALDAASSGALSQSDYEELVSQLRSNIKPNGFSLTQVDGFKSNLDKARASSFITEFAAVNPE